MAHSHVRKHSASKSKTDRRPRADDVLVQRKPSPGPGKHGERVGAWLGYMTETRQERSERLYGTTLRHENTGPYRSSDPGHFYQEGPGRGKGKIVSSTSSPAGKFSMRHKYQAKIQNELRETYGARDSIGGSLRKSGHGVHEGDVSMNNPPEYR